MPWEKINQETVSTSTERVSYAETDDTVVSASTGSSYAIDVSAGTVFDLTLSDNVTLSFTGVAGNASITLILTQDGAGGRSVTWPSAVEWASGNAPGLSTAASATDIVTLTTPDGGTTWYGFLGGRDFK